MKNKIKGLIFNAYLRLYCKIEGIPPVPKRCQVCGAEVVERLDKTGYICENCRDKQKEKPKESPRQLCQIRGCNKIGCAHHLEDTPKITWLCIKHHSQWFRGVLTFPKGVV